MLIGKKRKAPNTRTSDVGLMALVDVPRYAGEWPQVGKIISQEDDMVSLHWFAGSKTTSWKPCKRAMTGGRGKREDWIETIPTSCIVSTFQLTASGNIPKNIKEVIDNYNN